MKIPDPYKTEVIASQNWQVPLRTMLTAPTSLPMHLIRFYSQRFRPSILTRAVLRRFRHPVLPTCSNNSAFSRVEGAAQDAIRSVK